MRIVVFGAHGLIGTQLVKKLRAAGHDIVPASRESGVNVVTGEGLETAMRGADVAVDVTNSPDWEDNAVLEFFQKSTRNLTTMEKAAGVRHHVALSVVGTDRMTDSGYFRAKLAQENLIKASGVPYTIVRATQFFEFANGIAQSGGNGDAVRMTTALLQPIASGDVAEYLAEVATNAPVNGMVEVAGPTPIPLADFVRDCLVAHGDHRPVVGDDTATYFGSPLTDQSLTPAPNARLGKTLWADWLRESVPAR